MIALVNHSNLTTQLLNHQHTGHDVPTIKVTLPKNVKTTRNNPGQIQQSHTETTNAGDLLADLIQLFQKLTITRLTGERHAGGKNHLIQITTNDNAQALFGAQEGALTLFNPKQVIDNKIISDTGDNAFALTLQNDVHHKIQNNIHKINNTIQRVDNPSINLVDALDHPTLFPEKTITGAGLNQQFKQGLFGLNVGISDEIRHALLGNLQFSDFTKVTNQTTGNLPSRFNHDVQQSERHGHGRAILKKPSTPTKKSDSETISQRYERTDAEPNHPQTRRQVAVNSTDLTIHPKKSSSTISHQSPLHRLYPISAKDTTIRHNFTIELTVLFLKNDTMMLTAPYP